MTIKELIGALQKAPDQDLQVVLAEDSEGNNFNTVRVVDFNARFEPKERTVSLRKLTPSLIPHGFCEEDVGNPDTHDDVVVLWP